MVSSYDKNELEIIRLVVLSSCSFSIVGCLYILWHHFRRPHGEVSMTRKMVVILSIMDMLFALPKTFGRKPIDYPLVCNLQASLLSMAGLMIVSWNACMAHSMYRWIVCRDSDVKIQSRLRIYVFVSVVPGIIINIYLLSAHMMGDAIFYCWIKDRTVQFFTLYLGMIISVIYMSVTLFLTQAHISKRAATLGNLEVAESVRVLSKKLRVYVLSFVVLWMPSLVFRVMDMLKKNPSFALAVLMQVSINSQGFVNGILYGGMFTWVRASTSKSQATPRQNSEYNLLRSPSFHVQSSREAMAHTARIFISTFNLGESKPSKRDVELWIPCGHDIYVIGVQECLYLAELRSLIRQKIEEGTQESGRVSFRQYCREIGSTNRSLGYHGHIAITVFARESDITNGAFYMPSIAHQEVSRGKPLVFGRASNKGAVGFAFRYYDTSLAFVTCHLTSDSKGKSKMLQRNKDIYAMLKELNLNGDDLGFEFPLIHHHSFILGDLNYRMNGLGSNCCKILDAIARAGSSNLSRISSLGEDHFLSSSEAQPQRASQSSVVSESLWSELLVHDELLHLLSKVFYPFKEARILFPPTYKRRKGAKLDYSSPWSVEDLYRCFTTSVKNAGNRVPSYTDRILYASQKGTENRLRCLNYFSCEEMTISDHKPVSSVFELTVERNIKPIDRQNKIRVVERMKDISGVEECQLLLSLTSLSYRLKNHPVEGVELAQLQESDIASYGSIPVVRITVLFPLPSEDIFSEQRKLHELANRMKDGVFSDAHYERELKRNIVSIEWGDFSRLGIRHTTLMRPRSKMHVAVKLQGEKSKCIGQGVIYVELDRFKHSETPEVFEIDITAGGRIIGKMSGTVHVKVSRLQ